MARQHLELAKQELGVTEIPPLVLLTDDGPIANKQSEYFQNLFARTLGIEVRIDKQIFRQRIGQNDIRRFRHGGRRLGP